MNLFRSVLTLLGLFLFVDVVRAAEPPAKPNIVFILADDLGYGDLGCYGQTKIRTPHLDKLAADGIRFTHCYSGSTVCAPSRCTLITGLHTGHCRVRGNGGFFLNAEDVTVAKLLHDAGYATGVIGKWGLGDPGTAGVPSKQGFDEFFGFLNHTHAHNYYPDFLWRHETKVPLNNVVEKGVASKRVEYAPDLFTKEALAFVEANKSKPFFLYFAPTLPHANNERTKLDGGGNEVPSDEPYTSEKWPQPEKNKAAMITRLDADIGKLLAKLAELGLEENTIVIFASDNGPHKEGGNDPAFFTSSGPFRGIKRSLTDGGIRVPGIVRWKGVAKADTVSPHVWAFWDFLPTACDLAGLKTPSGLDGVSFAPTITGKGMQTTHDFLYWEFHENGSKQAVRYKDWKAIRPAPGKPLLLYDTKTDVTESNDVASKYPKVIETIEGYLKTARTESKDFPLKPPPEKK